METKKEAIKRLLKENEELFVVTNILREEVTNHCTDVWNIYAEKEKALNWVNICENYGKQFRKDYISSRPEEPEDDGDEHLIMQDRFSANGVKLSSVFLYKKISRGAA